MTQPAPAFALQILKPARKVQEFCVLWNRLARRVGIAASIAVMHIRDARGATQGRLVLTTPSKRAALTLALPSLGPAPHAPPRALQDATVQARGYAEDVVSVGGTVRVGEQAAAAPHRVTDLDVVKAALTALLAHEGLADPAATP